MKENNSLVFIVGPTAVGKSSIAFQLAEQIQGEIVSCDSMQIYREINIASAKPSLAERQAVAHHLIDCVSMKESYDVFQYFSDARSAIEDILDRGRTPVVVGGTGLYMKILLDGIFEGAGKNEELRQHLMEEAELKGSKYLYAQLKSKDPEAAAKLHPNDLKRVVRALEVCLTEEQPISKLQKQKEEGIWGRYPIQIFGLNREREELYARVEARVDDMFQAGLVEEVKAIVDISLSETAKYLIGIKEVMAHLRGEYDLSTAKEKLKQNTRRFAKRQLTWFRGESRIQWINLTKDTKVEDIVSIIIKGMSKK